MTSNLNLIPKGIIEQTILYIRNQKVMIDADLARIYGVSTKRLNEQVKRNLSRFPIDFMFQLTPEEKAEVVANCDHLLKLKFSNKLPYVFTEHGAVMLASILNSQIAIDASIQIVRAFIHLREILASHKDLAQKIAKLEKKYDCQFKAIFDAIRLLMEPPIIKKQKIGFEQTVKE